MQTLYWILGIVVVLGLIAWARSRKGSMACEECEAEPEPVVVEEAPVAQKAKKVSAKKTATKKVVKKGKK